MERRDDGKEHVTWKDRTLANNIPLKFNDDLAGGLHHWVPEPAEALTKEAPLHYKAHNH